MGQKFYVTTPIYYVNDSPHIGHAYTTIAADVLARYHRACGHQTWFLTGADEHGVKIVKAAAEKGLTPRQLADSVVVHFQEFWKFLNISNDDFIRTSDARHEKRLQAIMERLLQRDQVYQGKYEGWYDEGQEEFVTESAARENQYQSAISGKPLVRYSEPSWFFRLSQWREKLLAYIQAHPEFIRPESRRNEVLSKLADGLEDLSISRSLAKLDNWGVSLPNDPTHCVYVWIDALSNYITALGYPPIGQEGDQGRWDFWPASLQLIGKDILWFHTVYWPCLLMALDVPLPRTIFAHGWWTSEGKKMSKSLGNFVSREVITELCNEYSRDAFRYFVLREVPFGADGDFSRQAFQLRYNVDLANGVGNLLARTVNMIGRYFQAQVPQPDPSAGAQPVQQAAEALIAAAGPAMEQCRFNAYLDKVQDLVNATNKFIDVTEPFKLAKDATQRQRLGGILYACAEAVRLVLSYLEPFMPDKAAEGLSQLGLAGPRRLDQVGRWGLLTPGQALGKAAMLFPRKL